MRIPSGTIDKYMYFVAVDAADFSTRETGLSSFTVYRSRNGAAAAAMTTPTINETDATNMPGVYELLLDEDMTIDAGDISQEMVFHITATGMAPVTRTIELYKNDANVVSISGDTTAADNLEAMYDGTGYTDANAPAKQSQLPASLVDGKMDSYVEGLTVGAGGISTVATSATITTGSQTLTYTSTTELDGTTHDVEDAAGSTEFYYEFNVGVTGIATEVRWNGYAQSNGDSYTISGYDWVSASWKTIGTIVATNTTSIIERTFLVTRDMTGTGANSGIVRWRVTSSDGTKFATDRILVEYTASLEAGSILHSGIAQAGGSNTITLDSGANSNDDFYNHAKIVISSGTGTEQERIIVDYNGTTKVATVAPPWITQPDSTSAFEVEPGNCHAETGWGTIKVGILQAATSTTATLDSAASSIDDYYNNELLHIDAGTGEGQVRVITDYNGTTKVATINAAWTTTPDTTSEYIVEEAHPYIDTNLTNIETDTQDIQSRLPAALTAGGHMDSSVEAIVNDATAAANLKDSALGIVRGQCSGVPTTTSIPSNLAETTVDHYVNRVVVFLTGNAAGSAGRIEGYAANGTLTISAVVTAPASGDDFVIV